MTLAQRDSCALLSDYQGFLGGRFTISPLASGRRSFLGQSKTRTRTTRLAMGLEDLKKRIHSFRMPIRNPRLLLAVKMVYLFTPVVLGYGVMQLVIPDPEELKKAMAPPSEAAAALTKHQKDGLRDILEQAQARNAQAQAQR